MSIHDDLKAYLDGELSEARSAEVKAALEAAGIPLAINLKAHIGRPDLIMPIIAGIGEVDSAEPSHAMWALSRLDPASEAFRSGFEAFLYEYGSRGPNEWEVRSPTWETRPTIALAAIDRMRQAPDSSDPALKNAERATEPETAAATLLAALPTPRIASAQGR